MTLSASDSTQKTCQQSVPYMQHPIDLTNLGLLVALVGQAVNNTLMPYHTLSPPGIYGTVRYGLSCQPAMSAWPAECLGSETDPATSQLTTQHTNLAARYSHVHLVVCCSSPLLRVASSNPVINQPASHIDLFMSLPKRYPKPVSMSSRVPLLVT